MVVITGPDGAGKTTLQEALAAQLGLGQAGIWDALERPDGPKLFASKREVDAYLCSLSPNARLLFLAHALRYALDAAEGKSVLFNSYFYKYFASELALGADVHLVKQLSDSFPKPDQVFYLELAPEIAVARKKVLSRYECGLAEQPSPEAFVSFQQKVSGFWSAFERENWVVLDAQLSPDALLETALQHIAKMGHA